MKFFIVIVLTLISFYSFSQISIDKMEDMTDYNSSEMEDWALNNNFPFDRIDKYENYQVVRYTRKYECEFSFSLKLTGGSNHKVSFQLTDSQLYKKLKNEAISSGYKFINSEVFEYEGEKYLYHNYENTKYSITLCASNPNTHYGYSILVSKK